MTKRIASLLALNLAYAAVGAVGILTFGPSLLQVDLASEGLALVNDAFQTVLASPPLPRF